jgi:hypothetical protein
MIKIVTQKQVVKQAEPLKADNAFKSYINGQKTKPRKIRACCEEYKE